MCCVGDGKVHAVGDNSFVRWNGWTLPLNMLQVVSWFVLVYIAFIFFGVVALAVETRLWPAVYICVGLFYVVHIICYLAATSINPADDKSIERMMNKNKPLPIFNRSLHRHVIEDDYCHICEVSVGSLSKHCSVCNKCVAVFDHHCKWLNNCIGEKNYRIFLAMLLSAIFGCIGMIVASIFVLINFVQDFKPLNQYIWWSTTSSSQIAFEVLIGIEIFILLVTIVLLLQLFSFHISLIYKGITTYEYVKRDMNEKKAKEKHLDDSKPTEADSGAVCNNMPDVMETPRGDDKQVDEQFANNQKEMDALPKHPLLKTLGGGYTNSVFSLLGDTSGDISSMNANSNNMLSCGNLSYDDDSGLSTTSQPKPSARVPVNTNGLSSSVDRSHILPNVVPDTIAEVQIHAMPVDPLPPKHGKRRRKKKASDSLSSNDTSSRPLPKPLFTVMESPSSLSLLSLRNTQLPPVRDSVDWMSSSEDLTKGAMKSRKLPALSASSSMTSISKSMISEV